MSDSVIPQTSELAIRPIDARDAAEVAVLAEQLGYRRSPSDISAWIQSLPERAKNQAAFVACIGDEVLGWIEVSIQHHLQSPPRALIGGLVVKHGHRNRQIGQHLCNYVERWTWLRGLPVLRVTSRSTRHDAHRFYERNGYLLTKLSHIYEKHRPE